MKGAFSNRNLYVMRCEGCFFFFFFFFFVSLWEEGVECSLVLVLAVAMHHVPVESLIRNIAFRETYNSIKTGISTPSSSVSLPKGQKAGAESGKGSGKRKTKKNGRSNTVATGAGSDVGDSGVGGPQFPPAEALAPLCYVPDIDLGFDGRDDDDDWNTVSRSAFGAADIEESEQNEPEKRITPKFADNESSKMGPLARRFFSASSFSRSDVLVLSLQCLVGSSASLREIREVSRSFSGFVNYVEPWFRSNVPHLLLH